MAAVKRARKAAKDAPKRKAKRSHLEVMFIKEWRRLGGPELAEEFRFHEERKWRADFAHLSTKTLIEIEGGAAGGRHTRVKGFMEDLDKYLTAYLHGYTVVRIGAHQVKSFIIRSVIGALNARMDSAESRPEHSAESSEPDADPRPEPRRHSGGSSWVDAIGGDGLRQTDPTPATIPDMTPAGESPAWLGGGPN